VGVQKFDDVVGPPDIAVEIKHEQTSTKVTEFLSFDLLPILARFLGATNSQQGAVFEKDVGESWSK
jgi:hypothetical protein